MLSDIRGVKCIILYSSLNNYIPSALLFLENMFWKNIHSVYIIQGDFFNWSFPKNHKYGKKLKYQKVVNILLTEKKLRTFRGGPVDT